MSSSTSSPTRQFKYPVATSPPPTKYKLQSPRGPILATRIWFPTATITKPSSSQLSSKPQTKPPTALVLLVHGGGWHSGYFEELAKCLTTTTSNSSNVIVGSYDQVGCGYSDKEPGTPPGHGVGHINSFDDLIEDMFEAVTWLKTEAADPTGVDTTATPLFLIGESFGGLQVCDERRRI
jgi:alpha-beta hydrolase superfamily lysophospholipase